MTEKHILVKQIKKDILKDYLIKIDKELRKHDLYFTREELIKLLIDTTDEQILLKYNKRKKFNIFSFLKDLFK
jgi:hypothetical protein